MKGVGMNRGHGHVIPRDDGLLARCGGPSFCKECAAELAKAAKLAELEPAKPGPATYYYQSLPCFGHAVYKCCGLLHEDEGRRAYYRAYYVEHEVGSGKPGTFRVLERPYTADRIWADGTPYDDAAGRLGAGASLRGRPAEVRE